MGKLCVEALCGRRPYDLVIRNVKIVNVFMDTIQPGSIAIVGDRIAYIAEVDEPLNALEEIDGQGQYALPGFIDSHMHLESSMLTPAHFARVALSCGTTCVAADPHEIGNVLGFEGVKALSSAGRNLMLKVLMMAPSTIPSSPGYEHSGWKVGAEEAAKMLDLEEIHGLGEVMDFNGVANGEDGIISVVEEANKRGCIIDGHASGLSGRRLQVFRAAGIDNDHTTRTPESLMEELSLGFTVQIQECMLTMQMVHAMNTAPIQNRICLVTDDVPLPKLMHNGHLNHVVAKAIELGLDPLRAIRYATINPAERLRLHETGALVPGRLADIQLVKDLCTPKPSLVLCEGKRVFENGKFCLELPQIELSKSLRNSVKCREVKPEDFAVACDISENFKSGKVRVNVIHQDGRSTHTERKEAELPLLILGNGKAVADCHGYCKMAVFNRYGIDSYGLALIDGLGQFKGAVALTYGHDSHNLSVYGSDDEDMALAANTIREVQGGICAVCGGKVLSVVRLPLAGLMSEETPEDLLLKLDGFLEECSKMGFHHEEPMVFFTVSPLAVSPEITCTDMGLLDVKEKKFLPLVLEIRQDL